MEITAGPDGNMWFTEAGGNIVAKITPDGVVTEYPIPPPPTAFRWGSPPGLTAICGSPRSGGIRWARSRGGCVHRVPGPTPDSQPEQITVGPDGNLWFTEHIGNKVGQVTTDGVFTEFPVPTAGSIPFGITAGPDGNLWFTEEAANRWARSRPTGC